MAHPLLSDRIKYKNTDDGTTYTIVKNKVTGKLGYRGGYASFKSATGMRVDGYESSIIDSFEDPLHEVRNKPIKIYQTSPHATPTLQRAFDRVHNQQRWEGPESMFNDRANPGVEFGTGGWLDSLEHGGDLVHRASYAGTSEDFGGGGIHFGRGAVLEKAERLLRRYTSAYGFARDVAEQIDHNYHYYSTEGKFKGTKEEFRAIVKAAGERYSQAYEKIQPITIVQKLGRDIAIDTGRFQFDQAVPKLKALIRVLKSPEWEKFYWAPLKGIIKEYVTPPWPKAVLTKKDEARAVQFIKKLTDKHMKTFFPDAGEKSEKAIRKLNVIPSEHPTIMSDRSVYLVTLSGGQSHKFEIFFSNRVGLLVKDPINYTRYYVDDDRPENELKENIEKGLILTKQDEARAVQFIRGIEDSGIKPYGKTLRKIFNMPSASEMLSPSAHYQGKSSNGTDIKFRICKTADFGLLVRDEVNSITYLLDRANPYKKESLGENKEEFDPKFRITKKEEAQAVQWLRNQTEKGERFGKNLRKIYDQVVDGRHKIEYIASAGGAVGIFEILKDNEGWIYIRTNSGSIMKMFEPTINSLKAKDQPDLSSDISMQ